jgi:hypothetical protein
MIISNISPPLIATRDKEESIEFDQPTPWGATAGEDDGPTQRVITPRVSEGTGRGRGACGRRCERKWRATKRQAMDWWIGGVLAHLQKWEENRVRTQDGGYGLERWERGGAGIEPYLGYPAASGVGGWVAPAAGGAVVDASVSQSRAGLGAAAWWPMGGAEERDVGDGVTRRR